MFRQAAQRLAKLAGRDPETTAEAFWVPGRIEVVGKHTDYAGGRSLLAAVNRGFAVVAAPRADGRVGVYTRFPDGRQDRQELELTADLAQLQRFRGLPPSEGGWAAYPAAAVQRLVANFGITVGADIGIECNLPEASGMSSSSAVICYMWLVLDRFNGISSGNPSYAKSIRSPAELYTYLGNIENGKHFKAGDPAELSGAGGVGTFGGSEDHTAIMSCLRGSLGLWQYCPTEHLATVTVDPDVSFVVAVSGAKAEKTGNAMGRYNDASLLAQWTAVAYTAARAAAAGITPEQPLSADDVCKLYDRVSLYNPKLPNLAEVVRQERAELPGVEAGRIRTSICARLDTVAATFKRWLGASSQGLGLNVDGLEAEHITTETLKVRFGQFFEESEVIVPGVAIAFATRDYESLGKLVDRSHEATVSELGNTVPETAWLPRWARRRTIGGPALEGLPAEPATAALAASAFGAGFGGSCWALVRTAEAEAFCHAWRQAYEAKFPAGSGGLEREFFVVPPCPGAFPL